MASTASSLTFHAKSTDKISSLAEFDTVQVQRCRLDSLPQLAGESRVVCKIDVEGHEAEVLDGMADLFTNGRISVVMIDGFEDKRIPARLREAGFELYDGRSLCPFNEQTHFNVLAVVGQDKARIKPSTGSSSV